MSTVRFGRAVRERDALEERRVRVEHRRRDLVVVGVDRRVEGREVLVGGAGFDEDLGGATPDHHQTVAAVLLAELPDVGPHDPRAARACSCPTSRWGRRGASRRPGRRRPASARWRGAGRRSARGGGRCRARRPWPRPRRRRRGTGPRHRRRCRRAVRAATKSRMSGARSSVRLPEPDGAHLRQRPDRLGLAGADELDAGDEGRGDGAEADREDAELAVGRGDLGRGSSGHVGPRFASGRGEGVHGGRVRARAYAQARGVRSRRTRRPRPPAGVEGRGHPRGGWRRTPPGLATVVVANGSQQARQRLRRRRSPQ